MNYTKELPKVEGFYWLRGNQWDGVVKVRDGRYGEDVPFDQCAEICYPGSDVTYPLSNTGNEWAGPIPMPEQDDGHIHRIVIVDPHTGFPIKTINIYNIPKTYWDNAKIEFRDPR